MNKHTVFASSKYRLNVTESCVVCMLSGFIFAGDEEPTALLQYDGGPCAVIVPVQAFLLKNLLFSGSAVPENWRHTAGLCNILCEFH